MAISNKNLCNSKVAAAAILIVIAATFAVVSGLRYTVGDSVWSIPPQPDYYSNWSASHIFYIGDVLVFEFESEFFNVVQVPRLDYESCSALNPIKITTKSPALAILTHEGVYYYICSISNYCDLGQKFSVVVHRLYHPNPTDHDPPPIPPSPSPLQSLPPLSPHLSPQPSQDGWTDLPPSSAPVSSSSGIAPIPQFTNGDSSKATVGGSRSMVIFGLVCALGIYLFIYLFLN